MTETASLLSRPIKLGGHLLPNRFVMGSMHTGLEGRPDLFDRLARFYAERAKGGAALIVTGGFSMNLAGRIKDHPCTLTSEAEALPHRQITEAVHQAGGRILLQLLHAGRYGYHSAIVAPSAIKSPINRDAPQELSEAEILETIQDYARSTRLALEAGYDGVEVMGSEGYLISQFLAERTNHRSDDWGGTFVNRLRFPRAVTRAVREALGTGPILSFRMSAADLIDNSLSDDEVIDLALAVEEEGADCISTGIGWHESAVPTIAGVVPHAAFGQATKRIKQAVSIPVIASNRINLPETAERVLAEGMGDLVSMARPFLADPAFARKMLDGAGDRITLCIGCNQACLDHYFTDQVITCLVNPRAVQEESYTAGPAKTPKRVAVIGAGVAGIACALEASRRGHQVTLFDQAERIGGQFLLAAEIPGKADYGRAMETFAEQLEAAGVALRLGQAVEADAIAAGGFDVAVVATGVTPRPLDIPGADHPKVAGYSEVLDGRRIAGERVLVIGGGGIGHDVALFLAHPEQRMTELEAFQKHWGIGRARAPAPAARQVTMLKRSPGRFGRGLGKSTGWILRQELKDFGVTQLAEVTYKRIDDAGLHIQCEGRDEVLEADTIVVCAGQLSQDHLAEDLTRSGLPVQVVGGARLAGELDAKRAMEEGTRVGNSL